MELSWKYCKVSLCSCAYKTYPQTCSPVFDPARMPSGAPSPTSDISRPPPGNDRVKQPPRSYQDYKEGAWIGGAMDASPKEGKKVAVSRAIYVMLRARLCYVIV